MNWSRTRAKARDYIGDSVDPKMNNVDPKMNNGDPKMNNGDPKM